MTTKMEGRLRMKLIATPAITLAAANAQAIEMFDWSGTCIRAKLKEQQP